MSAPRTGTIVLAVLALLVPAAIAEARGSASVAALQVALRAERLYDGTVDGIAGPGTHGAVAAFQRGAGLAVDGIAGRRTRRALGRRGRPGYAARMVHRGARGWDVAAMQFLLAWRGFPSGAIDGGFGLRTKAALVRYQSWAGLTPDGVAGPTTLRSLRRPPPRAGVRVANPVGAPVGDRFGPRGNRFHSGVDFVAATGAPIGAARSGRVVFAGWDFGGYGRLVIVDHGGGLTTWYAHLSSIAVATGAPVATGTLLGRVGASGRATGPHLHFEVRVRGAVTDPMTALG